MEKKDKFRFTVRFDETDQRHEMVEGILDRLGRKKARYLVEAVCFYEANHGTGGDLLSASKNGLESKTEDRIKAAGDRIDKDKIVEEHQRLEKYYDEADIATMKRGMNAFRRKRE